MLCEGQRNSEFSLLIQWWSELLEVARISLSFSLPWAISTHSLKKKYACYAFHFMALPEPLGSSKSALSTLWLYEPIFLTGVPKSCQLLCSLFFERWLLFIREGEPISQCICLQLLVITLNWGGHCSFGCGMGVCWGAAVSVLSSDLYLESSKCLWLSAALVFYGVRPESFMYQ